MAYRYDIDDLVSSLIGLPFGEILARLDVAAGAHHGWLRRPKKQRAQFEGSAEYSQFAKGALFFIFHAPGREPGGVPSWDFVKIWPLVEDMIAREIAVEPIIAWRDSRRGKAPPSSG